MKISTSVSSLKKGNTELKEKLDSVLSTMTEEDFTELMDQAISIAIQRKRNMSGSVSGRKTKRRSAFTDGTAFYQIGTHSFVMGDDKQTDYIMRKDLEK